jgi:hypothetical protein
MSNQRKITNLKESEQWMHALAQPREVASDNDTSCRQTQRRWRGLSPLMKHLNGVARSDVPFILVVMGMPDAGQFQSWAI